MYINNIKINNLDQFIYYKLISKVSQIIFNYKAIKGVTVANQYIHPTLLFMEKKTIYQNYYANMDNNSFMFFFNNYYQTSSRSRILQNLLSTLLKRSEIIEQNDL